MSPAYSNAKIPDGWNMSHPSRQTEIRVVNSLHVLSSSLHFNQSEHFTVLIKYKFMF